MKTVLACGGLFFVLGCGNEVGGAVPAGEEGDMTPPDTGDGDVGPGHGVNITTPGTGDGDASPAYGGAGPGSEDPGPHGVQTATFDGCAPAERVQTATSRQVPGDYATIQAAIDAANYGDAVYIAPGVYEESLVAKSGVILIGAGADQTILDGAGQAVRLIDYSGAQDLVVMGLTLRGVGGDHHCESDVLSCAGNWYSAAVFADGHTLSSGGGGCPASITMRENIFEDNSIGFMTYWQPHVVVEDNIFRRNGAGFVANHHADGRGLIANNLFVDNDEAIALDASYIDVVNNIFVSNSETFRRDHIQEGITECNLLYGNAFRGDLFQDPTNVESSASPLAEESLDFIYSSDASPTGCVDAAGDPLIPGPGEGVFQ